MKVRKDFTITEITFSWLKGTVSIDSYFLMTPIQHSVLNVKVLADFNREEVLVGALTRDCEIFANLRLML